MCAEVIYIPGQSYERNPIIELPYYYEPDDQQQGRGDDDDGKRDLETQRVLLGLSLST